MYALLDAKSVPRVRWCRICATSICIFLKNSTLNRCFCAFDMNLCYFIRLRDQWQQRVYNFFFCALVVDEYVMSGLYVLRKVISKTSLKIQNFIIKKKNEICRLRKNNLQKSIFTYDCRKKETSPRRYIKKCYTRELNRYFIARILLCVPLLYIVSIQLSSDFFFFFSKCKILVLFRGWYEWVKETLSCVACKVTLTTKSGTIYQSLIFYQRNIWQNPRKLFFMIPKANTEYKWFYGGFFIFWKRLLSGKW